MKRIVISIVMLMAVSAPAFAKGMHCSIHPARDTPDTDLPGLARLSQEDAEKIALKQIKSRAEKTADGELEAEHGCLVYSFDIHVSGKPGIEEIMIDAGTGKVLSHTHENQKQEAAEQAKDAAILGKPQQ